jgi:serine/threonine protein kinase
MNTNNGKWQSGDGSAESVAVHRPPSAVASSDDSRIDELADQFEAAWNAGNRISADAFLLQHKIGAEEETWNGIPELLRELRLLEKELERKYPQKSVPGKQVGNYEFFEMIGRGGMGELHRARHVLLDKTVAVKVLPEAMAEDSQIIRRFERELKLIGGMSHPNIVQAHGAERSDGKLLLVMEYIEGVSLQQMVASGKRLSIDEAVVVVRQIAAGLQYAHEQKVIHRDIKPANIMLTQEGVIKILDFGLGKFLDEMLLTEHEDESGPLTKLGSPLGTVDFLAPEQWDSPGSVDIRSDIYGLGCTF